MLIAFSGFKGSGKDTAASVLIEEYGFTKIAFADALREMLLAINPFVEVAIQYADGSVSNGYKYLRLKYLVENYGWDKLKREVPEVRRLLQVTGTEAGREVIGNTVWLDILERRFSDLRHDDTRYVITDCRFDNEVDFVYKHYGDVVWVERSGLESDGHASESTDPKKRASYVMHNDETIDELKEDVRFLMFLKGIGNAP